MFGYRSNAALITAMTIVGAAATFGVATASAATTPEAVLGEKGASFPFTGSGATIAGETIAELNTALGTAITATGVEEAVTFEKSNQGKYELKLKGSKQGAAACESTGAGAGVVALKGEFHLVFLKLAPLVAGQLFVVGETKITCGTLKEIVRGDLLAELPIVAPAVLTFRLPTVKCVKLGTNEFTKYINEKGEEVTKVNLEANLGLGFEKACLSVGVEIKMNYSTLVGITG